jgi:hypothetical protein
LDLSKGAPKTAVATDAHKLGINGPLKTVHVNDPTERLISGARSA